MTPTQYGKAFVRWWWLVALGLVLGTVCGLTVVTTPEPRYAAFTNVLLSANKTSSTTPTDAYQATLLAQERVQSYASVTDNPSLVTELASETGMTVQEVTASLAITVPTNTTVIAIRFVDRSPETAQAAARATASRLVSLVESVEDRSPAQPPILVARVVAPSRAPTAIADPIPWRNPVLASLAGLLLGLAAAVVAGRADRRVQLAETVAAETGAPVLGRFPGRRGDRDGDTTASAAVRELRAEVLLGQSRRAGTEAVLLATPAPGADGFADLALAMARSVASTGRSVALVEASLREPAVAAAAGLDAEAPGLAEALRGSAGLAEVSRRVDGVDVVAAGPATADPADLLQSETLPRLLEQLREDHDLVVVAAAGIDSELVALGSRCPTTVVAVRPGRTRRADLRETVAHLRRSGTQVLASVLLR